LWGQGGIEEGGILFHGRIWIGQRRKGWFGEPFLDGCVLRREEKARLWGGDNLKQKRLLVLATEGHGMDLEEKERRESVVATRKRLKTGRDRWLRLGKIENIVKRSSLLGVAGFRKRRKRLGKWGDFSLKTKNALSLGSGSGVPIEGGIEGGVGKRVGIRWGRLVRK